MIDDIAFEFTVTNNFEPGSVQEVNGGLRILVDDTRLNRHKGEAETDAAGDAETVGMWLYRDLNSLLRQTHKIVNGEVDVYESLTVPFAGMRSYLELEPLSQDGIRIAYRLDGDESESSAVATEASACGYAVTRTAFYDAVVEVCTRFLSEVEAFPIPQDEPLLSGFVDQLEEFEDEVRAATDAG